jgi:eukaryotic translation initiation factor 2C
LSLTQSFPKRPGHGTRGAAITVFANYFEVTPVKKNITLNRYSVSVEPEVKGRKLKQIITILLEDCPELMHAVSDFKSNILMTKKLNENIMRTITYRSEGEDAPPGTTVTPATPAPGGTARTYVVKVAYTGDFSVADLVSYLRSSDASTRYERKLEIIQVLNILLGHQPHSRQDVISIGGNKHFAITRGSTTSWNLGDGLEALRGYYKSVRAATGRILVNINVSHSVFIQSGKLDDLVKSCFKRPGTWGLTAVSTDKFLKRLRVETTHLPVKKNKAGTKIPRIKTIFGLARENDGRGTDSHPPKVPYLGAGAKQVEFFLSSNGGATGHYISVYKFFERSKF